MFKRQRERFWMVVNPSGSTPRVKHCSRGGADREAMRLAKMNPGQEFFVLKAVVGFAAKQPTVEKIKLASNTDLPQF